MHWCVTVGQTYMTNSQSKFWDGHISGLVLQRGSTVNESGCYMLVQMIEGLHTYHTLAILTST